MDYYSIKILGILLLLNAIAPAFTEPDSDEDDKLLPESATRDLTLGTPQVQPVHNAYAANTPAIYNHPLPTNGQSQQPVVYPNNFPLPTNVQQAANPFHQPGAFQYAHQRVTYNGPPGTCGNPSALPDANYHEQDEMYKRKSKKGIVNKLKFYKKANQILVQNPNHLPMVSPKLIADLDKKQAKNRKKTSKLSVQIWNNQAKGQFDAFCKGDMVQKKTDIDDEPKPSDEHQLVKKLNEAEHMLELSMADFAEMEEKNDYKRDDYLLQLMLFFDGAAEVGRLRKLLEGYLSKGNPSFPPICRNVLARMDETCSVMRSNLEAMAKLARGGFRIKFFKTIVATLPFYKEVWKRLSTTSIPGIFTNIFNGAKRARKTMNTREYTPLNDG